jgi:CBS domain-containing protein
VRAFLAVEGAPDDALNLLAERQVRRLPVVEGDRLVGIVAQADIARLRKDKETGEVVEVSRASRSGEKSADSVSDSRKAGGDLVSRTMHRWQEARPELPHDEAEVPDR